MVDSITGNVSRSSLFAQSPATVDDEKKKIVAPPTGIKPAGTTPEDSFIRAMEAAEAGKDVTVTGKGPAHKDPFISAIDSGAIDLDELDHQYSGKDMSLMGKFDRLKYLRALKRDGRISNTRYISLKQKVGFSFEEAALLESEATGRSVDPDEIKSDPVLMNKYGFVELDPGLADTIEELQRAGVDVTAGAPPSIRREVGRQFGEEAKLNALNELREQGQILHYEPSKLGMIITVPTINGPQKILLDELGMSGKDFLDMISEVPGVALNVAATAGAIIASPALLTGFAVPGLAMGTLMAISGASYFVGASASDIVNRYFTENQLYAVNQIVKDRGVEAGIAALIDGLLLQGVKFIRGVGQKTIGPVAGSGDLAVKNYLKSIAKGKQVIQYDQQGNIIFNKDGSPKLGDLQLTPGLATQSPTIQRIEGIAEKIPGSADVLEAQKNIIQKQLTEIEMRAKGVQPEIVEETVAGETYKKVMYPGAEKLGTSAEVGEEVSEYVSRQLAKDEAIIQSQRSSINVEADAAIDKVAANLSSTGEKVVKTKQAGEIVMDGVTKSRNKYVEEFDKFNAALRESKNYKGDMVIDSSDINKLAQKLETEFPTKDKTIVATKPPWRDTVVSEPILPKQLTSSLMDDLKNVNNMDIDQAIKFKGILRESLSSESIPTEADRLITSIIRALDEKIGTAIKSQGKDVQKAYNKMLKFEADNAAMFDIPIIKKVLNGTIEPENAIVPAIMQGDAATLRAFEAVLGKNSAALADAKSAAFNEMIRKSRSSLGENYTSPNALWDQIVNLPETSQKFLLGKDYKKVKNLLDVLAVERGIVDITQLSNMSGSMANKLQKVIAMERAAEKNWKNKFLKPFLKDKIDETAMNVADFTKYFLKTANPPDITNIMNKFSPKLREKIQKRVIQEILESGRTADPDLILKEFATGQTPPHPALYKALFNIGGGDEPLARKKLVTILGKEIVDLLEDAAGIKAAQRVTQDVARSAGGLISGSIVNQLTNLKFGNMMTVIKYRIVAKILSSPTGRAWLTSQKKLPAIGPKTAGGAVASKEIMDLVSEEFENEPELKKIAINELERINAEYFERLEEDKKYNQRSKQTIEGTQERQFQRTEPVNVPTSAVQPAEVTRNAGVNEASRLATAFNPAGMMPAPTAGAINPQTMARGQQLFNKPGEITFANQGGIMSTNKAFQRVA